MKKYDKKLYQWLVEELWSSFGYDSPENHARIILNYIFDENREIDEVDLNIKKIENVKKKIYDKIEKKEILYKTYKNTPKGRSEIPEIEGEYDLFNNNDLIYSNESLNINKSVKQHYYDKTKKFNYIRIKKRKKKMSETIKIHYDDWEKIGTEFYGKDKKNWKFKCANCEHIQSVNSILEHNPKLDITNEYNDQWYSSNTLAKRVINKIKIKN